MAEIIASIEPGQYTGAQTVSVTFPAGTRKAIITRGDRNPVLTEILAYDTGYILPIPSNPNPDIGEGDIVERPFLAVTQDGRGNVIYDGGFPKFYNSQIKAANGGTYPATLPTTLAGLAPACKYLSNALNFIANPRKTAQGNRKILFINNTTRSSQYNIFKSHYNPDPLQNNAGDDGFRDNFDAVCNIGGWIPTYYDATSAGNVPVDISLATMEQYAAIVYLASYGGSGPSASWITENTASNIAQFRAAGSGVAIITDHCSDNYTDLDDAIARGGVFGYDATKVAKYFGAYFSGDVARRPVSVGEIRRQIGLPGPPGDHPLLAGMTDSETIFAGGSESLIKPELFEADMVDPDTVWSTELDTAGTYRINVLIQMDDGTIVTRPLRYVIIDPSDINLKDSFNRAASGGTMTTYKRLIDYTLDAGDETQTLSGKIFVGNTLVGWFTTAKTNGVWNTSYNPLGGPGVAMPIQSGSQLRFVVTDPFEYTVPVNISVPDPDPYWVKSGSLSTFRAALLNHPYYSGVAEQNVWSDITTFTSKYYPGAQQLGDHITGQWWKILGKARLPFGGAVEISTMKVRVYDTLALFNANKPSIGAVGDCAIIANTAAVYYWDNLPMVWQLHPQIAKDIFQLDRKILNTLDNSNWVIKDTNLIKV